MSNVKLYRSKKFADAWHRYLSQTPDVLRIKMMNEIMEKAIGDLKGKIVLEAGCGNGFFIPNLLKKHPRKLLAIDISKTLLQYAKEKIKSGIAEFKQMDLTKRLNFRTNSIDVIVSYNVLSELENISTPLREMTRILKPGGKMIISIVHPLYNLFVNDPQARGESAFSRLRRYCKIEDIKVSTIEELKDFIVCRKPMSVYINEILKQGLILREVKEVPISKKVAEIVKKYKNRIGIPVFVLFECLKEE